MEDVDGTLAAIDAALSDYAVGPDAMRSAPDGVPAGLLTESSESWEQPPASWIRSDIAEAMRRAFDVPAELLGAYPRRSEASWSAASAGVPRGVPVFMTHEPMERSPEEYAASHAALLARWRAMAHLAVVDPASAVYITSVD